VEDMICHFTLRWYNRERPQSPIDIDQVNFQDTFDGELLHSTQFKTTTDHPGKKVFIIGAGSSGMLIIV